MRHVAGAFALVVLLTFEGCVTINIYFPAAAAEKAADKIIDEVWQLKPGRPRLHHRSQNRKFHEHYQSCARFFVCDADCDKHWRAGSGKSGGEYAGDRWITGEHAKTPWRTGTVLRERCGGITRDGFIALRDVNAIALPQRQQVNNLVGAENADRTSLYREIARANGKHRMGKRYPHDFCPTLDRQGTGRVVLPEQRRSLDSQVMPITDCERAP